MNKLSKILSLSILLSNLFKYDVVVNLKKKSSSKSKCKSNWCKINTKKSYLLSGWNGYILDVKANVQGKRIKC